METNEKNSLPIKRKILNFLFYFFSVLAILEVIAITIFFFLLFYEKIDQNSPLETILFRWSIRLLLPSALLAIIFGDLSSD